MPLREIGDIAVRFLTVKSSPWRENSPIGERGFGTLIAWNGGLRVSCLTF
jgi:hypothetical protein